MGKNSLNGSSPEATGRHFPRFLVKIITKHPGGVGLEGVRNDIGHGKHWLFVTSR